MKQRCKREYLCKERLINGNRNKENIRTLLLSHRYFKIHFNRERIVEDLGTIPYISFKLSCLEATIIINPSNVGIRLESS